ncbi:hypothetical protein FS749_012980 [Ceratobasidium sp. UAMH 11750]|nr:hypothetical protein FS749_012980 [Ceratobasidium sp. UAMH 11750]
MRVTAALAALAAASSVQAHATFQYFWINGVDQGNTNVRPPASNSPVTSVTSNVSAYNHKPLSPQTQFIPPGRISLAM